MPAVFCDGDPAGSQVVVVVVVAAGYTHMYIYIYTHIHHSHIHTHTHIYIYIWSHPTPMIHLSLLVNTPVQSSVPRCLVLESESIGIYGVFCTSCTCLPDLFIPLYHR